MLVIVSLSFCRCKVDLRFGLAIQLVRLLLMNPPSLVWPPGGTFVVDSIVNFIVNTLSVVTIMCISRL